MSILSDQDIAERLAARDLVIEPITDPELQLQPSSVDLRLGTEFAEFVVRSRGVIRPSEGGLDEHVRVIEIEEGDEYVLHPGQFVLATTVERVEIPPDLLGRVEGRSSLGRLAIVIHATAGLCDPGYEGQITLELSNLGRVPVALTPGMRIAQIVLEELSSPSLSPYGSERGSKYQGQTGPTASRLDEDKEVRS